MPKRAAKTRTRPKSRTLYVKNPKAHQLATKLAQQLGVSMTEAVIQALEDKVETTARPIDLDRVNAIVERIAALPILDPRPADEILGYDDFGLPR